MRLAGSVRCAHIIGPRASTGRRLWRPRILGCRRRGAGHCSVDQAAGVVGSEYLAGRYQFVAGYFPQRQAGGRGADVRALRAVRCALSIGCEAERYRGTAAIDDVSERRQLCVGPVVSSATVKSGPAEGSRFQDDSFLFHQFSTGLALRISLCEWPCLTHPELLRKTRRPGHGEAGTTCQRPEVGPPIRWSHAGRTENPRRASIGLVTSCETFRCCKKWK